MIKKNEQRDRDTKVKLQQLRRESEEEKAKNLADKLGFSYIDLRISPIDEYALALRKKEEATAAKAAIIQKRQRDLIIVTTNPQSKETVSFIEGLKKDGYKAEIMITSKSNLGRALEKYELVKTKKEITQKAEIDIEELKQIEKDINNLKDLEQKLSQSNISATELLNFIMATALKLNSSDVHFEALAKDLARIRFRIDGVLQDAGQISAALYKLLLSRVKILSGLKLNIHDQPQDGRFSFEAERTSIEVRASSMPSEFGESLVLRVLDPATISLKLEDLGIQDYDFKTIEKELQKPNGMIITSGPTGSGKTTLLYAFLKKINTPELKIITLENPIEYHLEGVEQTQVSADNDYTFANGLRSILRQDPDIIMVGEIRDNETAETAIHAALTGHLVFSTLHTNDAAGAIPRLVDMKINSNLIPSALNLVIAQRLIRRTCQKCSKDVKPDEKTLEKIKNGLKDLPSRVKKPDLENITIKQESEKGCPACNFTRYKGRIGIFELFIVDEEMEKIILKTPSFIEIKQAAIKAGMVTMEQDGLLKILQKITTLEELGRVL